MAWSRHPIGQEVERAEVSTWALDFAGMCEKDTSLTHFTDCTAHSLGYQAVGKGRNFGTTSREPPRSSPPTRSPSALEPRNWGESTPLTSSPPSPILPKPLRHEWCWIITTGSSSSPPRLLPRGPVSAEQWLSRLGGRHLEGVGGERGSGRSRAAGTHQGEKSPARVLAAGGPSAAPARPGLPRATAPGHSLSWGLCAPLCPPTTRGSHGSGSGSRPPAAGAAVAVEEGGGYRRARPFAGCDRGCATWGAELRRRARRGGGGWEDANTGRIPTTRCSGRARRRRAPTEDWLLSLALC